MKGAMKEIRKGSIRATEFAEGGGWGLWTGQTQYFHPEGCCACPI